MITINRADRTNIDTCLQLGMTPTAWVKGTTFDDRRPVAYLAKFESRNIGGHDGPTTAYAITIFGKGKSVISSTAVAWPTPKSPAEWKTQAWLLADLAEEICTKTVEVTA